MIENFEKKRADKICNELYGLVKKFELIGQESLRALNSELQAFDDCCDHILNEYVKEEHWINYIKSIRKNVDNVLIGFLNIENEVENLYANYLEKALKDPNFPNIKKEFLEFKNSIKEYISFVNEQKEYIKPFKLVYEMFDGQKHMELVDNCSKKALADCRRLLNIVNEHSVELGNVDIDQQKQDKNELNSYIHLYSLGFFDHYIEKGLFERINNKQKLEQQMTKLKKIITKNFKKSDPAVQSIIQASIENPESQNVIYFARNFDAYLELLLCSAKQEYSNGKRKVKLRRRENRNLAQLLIEIEKERQIISSDTFNKERQELFTMPEENGLSL